MDLKETPTFKLADELSEIDKDRKIMMQREIEIIAELDEIKIKREKYDIRENELIYELWERIPSLKNNEYFQPKVLKK